MKKWWPILIVVLTLLCVYGNWLRNGLLSAPDFPLYYSQRLQDLAVRPYAWGNTAANGLGGSILPVLNLNTYVELGTNLLAFLFHMPWSLATKLLFFWPFLLVGSVSSFLFVSLFLSNPFPIAIGVLIYMTNTFILMLSGGGQMGLVLSYAFVPLVLWSFIQQKRIPFTISLFFLILFDFRFTIIVFGLIVSYVLFVIPSKRWWQYIVFALIPGVTVLGLHAFWIYPTLHFGAFSLPQGYDDPGWVRYLSWAEFSKSLSLLHPNWPENIFGKTYFMRPEFLGIPILVFCTLLLMGTLEEKRRRPIRYFLLLGLLGAFLSKGSNPPGGGVYEWLFSHVPTFSAFRDPIKFYLVTVISYTILIPTALLYVSQIMRKKWKYGEIALTVVFTVFWGITLFPAFTGKLTGTFTQYSFPRQYTSLERIIGSDTQFGRTLAVPWRNRYVFESDNHPVVDASSLFHVSDFDAIERILEEATAAALLKRLSVTYVVLPDDVTKEIFLNDRTYDPALRERMADSLDHISYLEHIPAPEKLRVYKTRFESALFYHETKRGKMVTYSFQKESRVRYSVVVANQEEPVTLIFSQSYDPNWKLWDGTNIISSRPSSDGLNSFFLHPTAQQTVEIYYTVQHGVDRGVSISLLTGGIWAVLLGITILRRISKRNVSVVVLVISTVLTGHFGSLIKISPYNGISDGSIWWSKNWQTITNPLTGTRERKTGFGGSEIRFVVRNSPKVSVTVSGVDAGQGIGLDVWVDGNQIDVPKLSMVPKQTIEAQTNKKGSEVRMRLYCSGEPFCYVRVLSIQSAPGGKIEQPKFVPVPSFAVLGDSLSVLYGSKNYTYLLSDAFNWQLHNASYNGSTLTSNPGTLPGISRFRSEIVPYQPDIILVALGTNDAIQKVPLEVFEREYRTFLKSIRTEIPKTTVYTLGLFRDISGHVTNADAYSRIIERVSLEAGATYIGTNTFLEKADFADSIHPNLLSQSVIAAALNNAMVSKK